VSSTPPPAPPNPPSSPLPQTAAAAAAAVGTSMAMVNMNNLLNGKDSRWLQLEVCREFQRNKCTRPDTECKFAHPPANVEVQNGRVTACYDSIKVGKMLWC
jgi:muscleblind protein